MPPAYVKPYVKRQKNDMADAEAICEAVTRANMRFVPTKTPEQQRPCWKTRRKSAARLFFFFLARFSGKSRSTMPPPREFAEIRQQDRRAQVANEVRLQKFENLEVVRRIDALFEIDRAVVDGFWRNTA